MASKGRSGGAGTAGGVDFQARVVAWVVCAILAEADAPPLWAWPQDATFETVFAEVDQPTDDAIVTNSLGGTAFIQAKARLSIGSAEKSEFASVIRQFVEQFHAAPLGDLDRLVLATGPDSPAAVRTHLPHLTDLARGLPAGRTVASANLSKTELATLSAATAHIKREWRQATGRAAGAGDVRALLAKVRVSVFDLADGGASQLQAQGLLRSSVLATPAQSDLVFGRIVADGLAWAATGQVGAGRQQLQARLTELGTTLKAAPSLRSDIARLKAYSASIADALKRFASLPAADGALVTIPRDAPSALAEVARSGSVLVTGEPGAGKSAVLYELAAAQSAAGHDVVVLAADMLSAPSVSALRAEIGLDHELVDVLRGWPGVGSGLLVIDAMDAARGEYARDTLQHLIGQIVSSDSRWRMAVSIRRFDLRYNEELKALFGGASPAIPDAYRSAEFAGVAHFNVPLLSDGELDELGRIAPGLAAAAAGASLGLRELIRTPFNLRLLAELTASGVVNSDLEPITTQLQLLDVYWRHRVLGNGGDRREVVLRAACDAMVAARSLRVARTTVVLDVPTADVVEDLLRRRVLIEDEADAVPRRESVAFAHHMLFDYAVARLLLTGASHDVIERTRGNPELLLIVRPSYELHFRAAWESDTSRDAFWEAALAMATTSDIPSIGRVIAPAIAAEAMSDVSEASPLLARRAEGVEAEPTLRHFISARLATGNAGSAIPSSRREAWAELLAQITTALDEQTAYHARNLLIELCTHAPDKGEAVAGTIGPASRRLLTWSLSSEPYHPHVARVAITAVVLTSSTSPTESEQILRALLEPDRLEQHGYLEFPAIADEAAALLPHSPELLADLYRTALSHEEKSTAPTAMSASVVMPLNSNRRQDFNHAHYELGLAFDGFLRTAPEHAIRALSEMRLLARHSYRANASDVIVVDWDGRAVEIEPDGTYALRLRDSHDLEDQALAIFESWAGEHATGAADAHTLLTYVQAQKHAASVWQAVVRAAAQPAGRLAADLTPLLSSRAALSSPEFGPAIGQLLQARFASLAQTKRRRIEKAIMSLPATYEAQPFNDSEQRPEYGERTRDRMLICLNDEAVLTAPARSRLAELREAGEQPALQDALEDGWSSHTPTERDHLREMGVDVDAPANLQLQALTAPVEAFASAHLNDTPSPEEISSIASALNDLWQVIATAEAGGADAYQVDRSWGHAADAAEAIARSGDLTKIAVTSLVVEILLASARHSRPSPPADSSNFDAHPSWGGAEPRTEAAQGLPLLALHAELCSPDVVAAIDDLSQDPSPAVRFQIAQRLPCLRQTAPEAMHAIASRILREDPSTAVLDVLVRAAPQIAGQDIASLPALLRTAFDRAGQRAGSGTLRETCAQAMVGLYVYRGLEGAGIFVDEVIVGGVATSPDLAHGVVHPLRDAFVYDGHAETRAGEAEAIRRRALDLACEILKAALAAMGSWEVQIREAQPTADDPLVAKARATAHIIDGVAMQMYFATGAYDEEQGRTDGVTGAQRARLYREGATLLDALTGVRYGSPTHHTLEALEAFIALDPRGVFLLIARTVHAAQASGYQGDSLAAALVVRLLERYLAEHPALLQQDDECRQQLIATLDLFVDAGWSEALQLTYRLQDIYR